MKSSLSCQTLARLELERNIDLMKFFHSMWMQEIFLCVVSKLIHPNILIKFLQSDFTDINGYCWITQHKTSLQSCFSNLIKKPIFDLALSGIWHNKHCFQPGLNIWGFQTKHAKPTSQPLLWILRQGSRKLYKLSFPHSPDSPCF